MRAWFVVAIAVAAVVLAPDPHTDPVGRALDALYAAGADDAMTLEALVAAGVDPTDWHGRDVLHAVAVPPPGPDPVVPLREAYAVLAAGADARAWDDPVRGRVDLVAELEQNLPAALASDNDAVHSFQLLAMAAAGERGWASGEGGAGPGDPSAVADLRQRLLSLQDPSGAWGCGPWLGPECTGFALAALHATGGVPDDVAGQAAAYIQSRYDGGAFTDPLEGPDVQVATWAIQGLRLVEAPVPDDAVPWVLAQQGPDGRWSSGGRPSTWATAEVVVMLSGGHPLGS